MGIRKVILIHYSEIGLKGGNRAWFEKKIQENIEQKIKSAPVKVRRLYGRLIVEGRGVSEMWPRLSEILRFIPGIANFSLAFLGSADLQRLSEQVVEMAEKEEWHKQGPTFRVTGVRSDKSLPYSSLEAQKVLGAALLKRFPLQATMKDYDWALWVELTSEGAFVYSHKKKGVGGLPVGSSGRVVSLLSAGIDSPVASYLMAKRGATLIYVHFHSYPQTSKDSVYKAQDVIRILNKLHGESVLYSVPLFAIQKEVLAKCPPELRVLLYRRFMMRIAESIAGKHKAKGLVTGESLGQVASQTLENMQAVSAAVSLPIYRPLIGLDKQEIINLAQNIGTYDISIQPGEDCCSLFVPRYPATKARLGEVEQAEKPLDVKNLAKQAWQAAEKIEVKNDDTSRL